MGGGVGKQKQNTTSLVSASGVVLGKNGGGETRRPLTDRGDGNSSTKSAQQAVEGEGGGTLTSQLKTSKGRGPLKFRVKLRFIAEFYETSVNQP